MLHVRRECPKSSADHQQCHTGQFIVATWFLTKKLQQSLIFSVNSRALARNSSGTFAPTSGIILGTVFLRSSCRAISGVRSRQFPYRPFWKVGFMRLLRWLKFSVLPVRRLYRRCLFGPMFPFPFPFPNFHLLLPLSAQKPHKTDTCPPASAIQPLFAGLVGFGGHLRVLRYSFTPHTIKNRRDPKMGRSIVHFLSQSVKRTAGCGRGGGPVAYRLERSGGNSLPSGR